MESSRLDLFGGDTIVDSFILENNQITFSPFHLHKPTLKQALSFLFSWKST